MSSINLTTADTTAGIPAPAPVAPMDNFAAAPGANTALVPYAGPGHIVAPGAVAAPGPVAAPAPVGPQPAPPANLPHGLINDRRIEVNGSDDDRPPECPPNVHKNFWHRLLNRSDSQLRKMANVRYRYEPTNTKTALKVARAYRLLVDDLCNARSNSPDRRLRDVYHTRIYARQEFFDFMILYSWLIDHSNPNVWTADQAHCA